ncbi:hypothetical protein SAMN05880582_104128 [Rhizobium sp. RU20A]|uniref:hypothetical protein n=1 Tax=Rhizobium sp. RU20A TaxID=1907412 RepID=UPI000955747D|nr:hypothetical protein [Rhizobium sp. RU20A]SIQ86708.1 hypothetical protein SAMN05880582_104128 [Rhizobium sp. RU20A]
MPPSARHADKTIGQTPGLTELGERFLSWWLGELRAMVPAALLARSPRRAACSVEIFLDAEGSLTLRAGDRVEYVANAEALSGIAATLPLKGRARTVRLDVPRALCLIRKSTVPKRALREARRLMAIETAENTPLSPDEVHADWYVESEEPETGRLLIRHVLLARERIAAIREALDAERLTLARLTVGHSEGRPVPVDLLSRDEPGLRAFLQTLGWPARIGFAGAVLVFCAVPFLLADRVERQTRLIEDRRADIMHRLQSIPAATPTALDLAAMPPANDVLDEIAARLPANATLQTITLADGRVNVSLGAGDVSAFAEAMMGSAILKAEPTTDPSVATFSLIRRGANR